MRRNSVKRVAFRKGREAMEHDRFDALVRRFATRQSRRGALARMGRGAAAAALTAIGFGVAKSTAEAQILLCADDGCRCRGGVLGSCLPGLVCCPDNGDQPGGAGTCVAPSACFGGICSGDGSGCPATCAWGANCLSCCSGYCGFDGACGPSSCRTAGCDCIAGTVSACDDGLACCPIIPGFPGGPGVCAPRGVCG